jgi:hypothetical protein
LSSFAAGGGPAVAIALAFAFAVAVALAFAFLVVIPEATALGEVEWEICFLLLSQLFPTKQSLSTIERTV